MAEENLSVSLQTCHYHHATVLLNRSFHSCTMGINDSNLAELPGKFEEVIPMSTWATE